ncbi:MAG: HEPN domain-containing protein [Methanobacteriota archaeon]
MSHSKNKVEWCLKKAEKELKERRMHRGLREVTPNAKIIRAHIQKAEHNLKAISRFKEIGYSDWSASAAFYSIYHSLLAIANKFGFESRNQECTFALIYHLIEEGKIPLDKKIVDGIHVLDPEIAHEKPTVIEVREVEQYGVATTLENETYNRLLNTAKTILDKTKTIIEE